MGEDTNSRAARAGRNQVLYRELNERVREMNEAFDSLLPLGEWICECADEECFERIEMTHRRPPFSPRGPRVCGAVWARPRHPLTA